MKPLKTVVPTPEQLKLIRNPRPGVSVIYGAAGSGKTTTALQRLKFLATFRHQQMVRAAAAGGPAARPVRILVLTFNRTLRGYIEALANEHLAADLAEGLKVATFASWATELIGGADMITDEAREVRLWELGSKLNFSPTFLVAEVEYVLGRYLAGTRDVYLTAERSGRGTSPRVDQPMRARILAEVIAPYEAWKARIGKRDWNDLPAAILAAGAQEYDVVVVDEAQDFTANQARAVMRHVAAQSAVTFVLDAAQRIYPRFFTWPEAGITIFPGQTNRLTRNYRNTVQIATLAQSLLKGMVLGDDGTMPDLTACTMDGPKPVAYRGTYSEQVDAAVAHLRTIDLTQETVAFLHPKGGGWFKYLRARLDAAGIEYVEIAKRSDWPIGHVNVALTAFHSAKGLEFDHVIAIGLSADTMPHGADEDDDQRTTLRRLLAMGIGRARKTVVLGYKLGEESALLALADATAIDTVQL